ncbi:MAG: hypothetical protein D6702_10645 [Planctomycetota bacterium]|nr:MAG: hypothetical protein D6702_10645 [Planctomycetota bacterium]
MRRTLPAFLLLAACALLLLGSALPTLEPEAAVRANQPPVADAGPDRVVPGMGPRTVVQLDGTASYDPDGQPLRYRWATQFPGAVISNPRSPRPLLVLDRRLQHGEEIEVGLQVSDGQDRDQDTVIIAVVPPTDCAHDHDDLAYLRLVYTGRDCSASRHGQEPHKVSCSGDPAMAPRVRITAFDKKHPADVWFDGRVSLGEAFALDAATAGKKELGKDTVVRISDLQGVLLQEVVFHTSGSQTVRGGDNFGALAVVGCVPCGSGGDFCASGAKPASLTMTYTGEDCSATSHSQDPGKVSCYGDPMMAPRVHILAWDNKKGTVWFDGDVDLGATFVIDSAYGGASKLGSETVVEILDLQGSLLQEVHFHTSCSQPLFPGDSFGGVTLVSFEPEGGNSRDYCDHGGKPKILEMVYRGSDCSATRHGQASGKVSCAGDPAKADPVWIVAHDGHGKTWFAGEVGLNTLFSIDAGTAGEEHLGKETTVEIYDQAGGTLLQTVSFHTSCSQPLQQGDRFGALSLVGIYQSS